MADEPVAVDVPQEAPLVKAPPIDVPVEPQAAPLPAAEVPAPEPEISAEISVPDLETTSAPPNNNQTVVVSQTNPTSIVSGHVLVQDERKHGNATRLQHRDEHLEKIMAHAREKKEIINDDVEKLLHISDATASRYLTMLVKQGNLIKEGKGPNVKYRVA